MSKLFLVGENGFNLNHHKMSGSDRMRTQSSCSVCTEQWDEHFCVHLCKQKYKISFFQISNVEVISANILFHF